MNQKISAYFELSSATIIIGSSVVVGKLITNNFPVFLSQGIGLAVALLVLLPFSFLFNRGLPKVRLKSLPVLFLQSFLGMFLFRVFLLYGLKYTTAINSGIITSSTPAFVSLLSFILLKERLSLQKILGIMLTVAGIILINTVGLNPENYGHTRSFLGIMLILFAVIGEAMLTILRKFSSNEVSSITGTFYVTLFSFLMFTPTSIIEAFKLDFSAVGTSQWLFIMYYGIIVTAVAYILWFNGVTKVPASTAAVYTGCIPVSTLVLSCLILREKISIFHITGIILAISGIIFVSVFDKIKPASVNTSS